MPENDESLDTPTPRTAPDTSQLHPGVASLLKWFECDPLPPHLRSVAEPLLGVPMVPAVINTARANELLGIG